MRKINKLTMAQRHMLAIYTVAGFQCQIQQEANNNLNGDFNLRWSQIRMPFGLKPIQPNRRLRLM